jgi:hypothetical protein
MAQMMVQAGEGAVETAAAKSAQPSLVEPAAVKSTPVKPAKSAPAKPSAAVGRSIGEVWLEHSSAQQSSGDYYQSPPASGSGAIFF